jgi:hypothetical protein
MKLTLVSIVINGIRFSKFVLARDGKVDINKVFPALIHIIPSGATVTVG